MQRGFCWQNIIRKIEKDSGQNPIDAARLGCKVYHGPFIYNFKEIFEILKNHQISEFVKTPETLANFLTTDLKNTKKDNKNFLLELDNLQQKIFLDTINKIKKFIK